ncbi:MAG: ferritin-like domain-containing protein [Archangium sp.]
MKELDVDATLKLLNRIMEFELAGVVRYTHYSLMVAGPNRIPIVAFMKAQATESLLHAQTAGEILVGLGGHPTLSIAEIPESYKHSVKDILEESLSHERQALEIYKDLLETVEDASVYLEEFARTQIAQEEMHGLEVRKMLRDVGIHHAHGEFPDAHAHDFVPKEKKEKKKDKKKKKHEDD